MDTGLLTIIFLGVLILLLGFGLRIAFCLGFIGVCGILTFLDPGVLYQVAEVAADTGTNIFLITLPLFILMAEVVSFSGVGDDMYTAAHAWLSWLPGGLAISSIATCTGFAAICGSSPATAASVGLVSVPEMIKRGYSKRLAVGSVSVGGTLGILIPPSITMIIYGLITETSIGKLFIAGVIPGLVISLILCGCIAVYVTLKPETAPRIQGVNWRTRFSSLNRIWAFIVLVISIMGSIYLGIATPEESAAVGATTAIFIAMAYHRLSLRGMHGALLRTVSVTAMIMFMVLGGNVFAFTLSTLGVPQYLTNLIVGLDVSPWTVMIVINIVFLILGCLLDPMSIMVICLPILFPIVTKLGFDPVWFGIIITINIEMGMITPPFGLNLFILKATLKDYTTMDDIVRGSLPFVILLMAGLAIVMIFPILATWLPSRMGV
ncbi:MAG: TRAP transporter large permease [Thermodesulfobacteriota bacterium]